MRCKDPHLAVEPSAKKVVELAIATKTEQAEPGLSFLTPKELGFLRRLLRENIREFAPKEISVEFGVTNRTVINWCLKLVRNGFLVPLGTGRRTSGYALTDLARDVEM